MKRFSAIFFVLLLTSFCIAGEKLDQLLSKINQHIDATNEQLSILAGLARTEAVPTTRVENRHLIRAEAWHRSLNNARTVRSNLRSDIANLQDELAELNYAEAIEANVQVARLIAALQTLRVEIRNAEDRMMAAVAVLNERAEQQAIDANMNPFRVITDRSIPALWRFFRGPLEAMPAFTEPDGNTIMDRVHAHIQYAESIARQLGIPLPVRELPTSMELAMGHLSETMAHFVHARSRNDTAAQSGPPSTRVPLLLTGSSAQL